MPTSLRTANCRPPRATQSVARLRLAALGGIALVTLAGALLCLQAHRDTPAPQYVLAPAGIGLLVSALVQLRVLYVFWNRERRARVEATCLAPLSVFLAGVFLLYLAALAVGPVPHLAVAWLAGVALWYAVWILPLAASPPAGESWRHWSQKHWGRRLNWLVYASLALPIVAELGLGAYHVAEERAWLRTASAAPPAPNHALHRLAADDLNLQFASLNAGHFRLAILGQGTIDQSEPYLARLRQSLPGLQVVLISLGQPWSAASAEDLARQLTEVKPDLALILVSACEDLATEAPPRSWFHWRDLQLVRATLGEPANQACASGPAPGADSFEAFLAQLTPQLAVCRTPIDETMHVRWRKTFEMLDGVRASCRAAEVSAELVIIPGEFQLNLALCETLTRRAGYAPEQIDLDLPQRRLASFAGQRSLPVLDLLPHLRVSGPSLYQRHATTWNERGNNAAAAAISGWLESRYGGQLALAAQLSGNP